jgi:hypothetical protein
MRKLNEKTKREIARAKKSKNLISHEEVKKSYYDKFLHKIQQPKMKELWDNHEDES